MDVKSYIFLQQNQYLLRFLKLWKFNKRTLYSTTGHKKGVFGRISPSSFDVAGSGLWTFWEISALWKRWATPSFESIYTWSIRIGGSADPDRPKRPIRRSGPIQWIWRSGSVAPDRSFTNRNKNRNRSA